MRMSLGMVMSLLVLAGCAAPSYEWDMENDLAHTVVVSGCADCHDGQRVEPGSTLSLTVSPGADIDVRRADGSFVGCVTASDSDYTWDVVPVQASHFAGLACGR